MALFVPYQPSHRANSTASVPATAPSRKQSPSSRLPSASRRAQHNKVVDLTGSDSDEDDDPARQLASDGRFEDLGNSRATAHDSVQNSHQAARESGIAEDDESNDSDGDDLPTLRELFAMSRGTAAADHPHRGQQAASSERQDNKGNGSSDGRRACGDEGVGAGSGPSAAGGPLSGLTVPANIDTADDMVEASGDDCARSPTTELSDSLYAAYMPSHDDGGRFSSAKRSAPEPLSVANGPGSLGKQQTPSTGAAGDDVVPAGTGKIRYNEREVGVGAYVVIACEGEDDGDRPPIARVEKVPTNGRLRVLWTYHPSRLEILKGLGLGPHEILLSDHTEVVQAAFLKGFTNVEENCPDCHAAQRWCWNKRFNARKKRVVTSEDLGMSMDRPRKRQRL